MAYRNVNFGVTYGGLLTVGYQLRGSNGVWGSRVTTGITEIIAGSGAYEAVVDESGSPTTILWTPSAGSTVVATEDLQPNLDVLRFLAHIRNRWEFYTDVTTPKLRVYDVDGVTVLYTKTVIVDGGGRIIGMGVDD